jgi:hypothetical protein
MGIHTTYKKASARMPTEWLIGTIILLAGFLLVFPVSTLFAQESTSAIEDSVCTGFISARSQFDGIEIGDWKILDIPVPCRKKVTTIRGDREAVKKQLSNYMAQCWVMFGQGKLTQAIDLRTSFGISQSQVADSLFPCYDVTIDQISGGEPITARELYQYMKATSMSAESSDKTTNYFDFITKDNGIGGRLALLEPEITQQKTYTIYFSDPSEELFPAEWGKLNGIYLKEKGESITIQEGFGLGNMERMQGGFGTEPGVEGAVKIGASAGFFAVGAALTASGVGSPVGIAMIGASALLSAGSAAWASEDIREVMQQEARVYDAKAHEVD